MTQIVLDAEAGQISTQVARRGVAKSVRVHAVVEISEDSALPMPEIAQAFDWLAEEPDLYSDADLLEPAQ